MRCVVDGCSPVFSLISFSEIASSREARTSISENMRSMTWMTGVAGTSDRFFLMAQCGDDRAPFYLVKSLGACQWPSTNTSCGEKRAL
ncbi:hypothetical protein FQZ97_534850 [compost metagenome]